MSWLTLTVRPRRPPQKGLIILDIDIAALWAAILILKQSLPVLNRRYPILVATRCVLHMRERVRHIGELGTGTPFGQPPPELQ